MSPTRLLGTVPAMHALQQQCTVQDQAEQHATETGELQQRLAQAEHLSTSRPQVS